MISDNAECFEIGKTQIDGHQILHNKRSQTHKRRGKKIDSSVAKNTQQRGFALLHHYRGMEWFLKCVRESRKAFSLSVQG